MSKWISVEDRLPKTSKDVLLAIVGCEAFRMGYWDEYTGEWFIAGWPSGFCATHWQPLPDPPERDA